MKKFNYVIKDALGLHARPAGMLAKAAQQFESKINMENKGKSIDAKKIMMILGAGIKCGEEVAVIIEGSDEDKAYTELHKFFTAQL